MFLPAPCSTPWTCTALASRDSTLRRTSAARVALTGLPELDTGCAPGRAVACEHYRALPRSQRGRRGSRWCRSPRSWGASIRASASIATLPSRVERNACALGADRAGAPHRSGAAAGLAAAAARRLLRRRRPPPGISRARVEASRHRRHRSRRSLVAGEAAGQPAGCSGGGCRVLRRWMTSQSARSSLELGVTVPRTSWAQRMPWS